MCYVGSSAVITFPDTKTVRWAPHGPAAQVEIWGDMSPIRFPWATTRGHARIGDLCGVLCIAGALRARILTDQKDSTATARCLHDQDEESLFLKCTVRPLPSSRRCSCRTRCRWGSNASKAPDRWQAIPALTRWNIQNWRVCTASCNSSNRASFCRPKAPPNTLGKKCFFFVVPCLLGIPGACGPPLQASPARAPAAKI